MSDQTVTLFFALCALGLSGVLIAVVTSIIFDRGDRFGIVAQARSVSLEAATVVAVACTAGSLHLSEVIGYPPCRLCWVQRGFMYPAAALLVAALVLGRRFLVVPAAVFSALGLPVSLFHRYEQATAEVGSDSGFCDLANPCSGRWFTHFGFVTIPTMAAVGFLAILIFVALGRTTSTTANRSDQ